MKTVDNEYVSTTPALVAGHDTVPTSNWNVISENDFKQRVYNVFDRVANCLSNTLGPYGSTTIIEKYGEMHITKDGWQVLKNLRFDNMLENNILMMLIRISAQVVIRVGDGSTTSIVAADAILKELTRASDIMSTLRPKDVMDILTMCTNKIISYIYNESKKIDKDNFDEIYKLAYVSTNGDDEIASIVKDIYMKTNNPSIEYISSKTNKTSYDIVSGYRSNISYIDAIFATNDKGTCVIDRPEIIMFDHKIDTETSMKVISMAINRTTMRDQTRRLVVIAPHYDKLLLEHIRRDIMFDMKQRGYTTTVYARASLVNNISHEMYNDLAILCGAQVISEQFIDEIDENTIEEYMGSVDQITIGDKNTLVTGFNRRNDNMYKKAIEDATAKYQNAFEENEKRGIVDMKLNEFKQRLTKLYCNMGIISVGGNSELEKKANFDLVEDAVKACESAYNYGYNIGCSLVIPRVIEEIIDNNLASDIVEIYGETLVNNVLGVIRAAYLNVYRTVLSNKFGNMNVEALHDIIEQTKNFRYTKVYNLITNDYSDDIINSCETDVEIIKASISIISLLISSNQYISINTEEK